jgi:hypothetical protein
VKQGERGEVGVMEGGWLDLFLLLLKQKGLKTFKLAIFLADVCSTCSKKWFCCTKKRETS